MSNCYSWNINTHLGEAMPKYEEIVEDISRKIANGVYKPGDRLPSAAELCTAYGVSKITVNKAMGDLVQMGFLTRRRGSGTYVKSSAGGGASAIMWKEATHIEGTKQRYEQLGKHVTTKVHTFSVIEPDERVRRALNMDGGFVYNICRSRFADGEPLDIEYTQMPVAMFPSLSVEVVQSSIYSYIEKDLGLTISSAHSSMRAVLPTEDECTWLGIEPNAPLLEVTQVAYLNDGRAFEFSCSRHTQNAEPVSTVRFHRFGAA